MATYLQCKGTVYRKDEDTQFIPPRKRSESRLKRYISTPDTRAWTLFGQDRRMYIIDLISAEPPKRCKLMGRYIPVDVICNILLATKNKHIDELEAQIKSFVELWQVIDFTRPQIHNIKKLVASKFKDIKELVSFLNVSFSRSGTERSVQVKPPTLTTISETEILTTNASSTTKQIVTYDRSSLTDLTPVVDDSNSTILATYSDAAVNAVPSVSCKGITAQSQSILKTKGEQTSEMQLATVNLPQAEDLPTSRIEFCDREVTPSISIMGIGSTVRSGRKSHSSKSMLDQQKSDEWVEFSEKAISASQSLSEINEESEYVSAQSSERKIMKDLEEAEVTTKSDNKIIEDRSSITISPTYCTVCGSISQVIRHDIATSISNALIKLETSNKSALESAALTNYISNSRAQLNDLISKPIIEIKKTVSQLDYSEKSGNSSISMDINNLSSTDVHEQFKTPNTKIPRSEENVHSYIRDRGLDAQIDTTGSLIEVVSSSTKCFKTLYQPIPSVVQLYKSSKTSNTSAFLDSKILSSDHTSSGRTAIELIIREEDDDEFHDCLTHIVPIQQQQYNGAARVVEYAVQLAARNSSLMKHQLLAKRAIWQLDLMHKTLMDNAETLRAIDVKRLSMHLLRDNVGSNDVIMLEDQLREICNNPKYNASEIFGAQLQLIKIYCKELSHKEKMYNKSTQSQSSFELQSTSSIIVDIPSDEDSNAASRYREQVEYYKTKLLKLDHINMEREKLRETVYKMENELKLYNNIKTEFILPELNVNEYDSEEYSMLHVNEMQQQIMQLKATAREYERVKITLENAQAENAKLKSENQNMFLAACRHSETLRYKEREIEMLQLEKNRLNVKVNELQHTQLEKIHLESKYVQLQSTYKQTRVLMRSTSCTTGDSNKLMRYKEDFAFAQKQADEIMRLENEKKSLLMTIVTKECNIADQEVQLQRLLDHIDRITLNNEEQQLRYKQLVMNLREKLEKKESYILSMDNELQWVEEKLRSSIHSLSKDSTEWHSKLTKLESCCRRYKAKIASLEDMVESLQKQVDMQEELNRNYSIELQKKDKILDDTNSNSGDHITRMRNVSRMENILKKSHLAVRKVVEELSKQYKDGNITKSESMSN